MRVFTYPRVLKYLQLSNMNNLNSRRKPVKNLQEFNCESWPKRFFFFSLFKRKEAKAHFSCLLVSTEIMLSLTDTPMTNGEGTHEHFKKDSMAFPSPCRRTIESPVHTSTSVWIRKYLYNFKEIYHTCTGYSGTHSRQQVAHHTHHCRKCNVSSAEEGNNSEIYPWAVGTWKFWLIFNSDLLEI